MVSTLIVFSPEVEEENEVYFLAGHSAKQAGWKAEPFGGRPGDVTFGLRLDPPPPTLSLSQFFDAVARLISKWRDPDGLAAEYYNSIFRSGGGILLQLELESSDRSFFFDRKYLKLLGSSGIDIRLINYSTQSAPEA